ncbi:WRKY transcription factor 55 [Manihot esculenta]|uniref:WRKY transcription factor 78 n=1 Tax=Manihot esculenta TaxID=3983 RepID=A0A140H8T2_MANES|nr:WRKY transcription factor 55 [Manihot esculenta]AMO00446.1 WRKY transcription factor 78 [Manihot esculenta]OAY38277.1 hypothetical protein MANES_10G002100v8 [Manihot esculenta]
MDEFISLILQGVKLAKDLEPAVQNLATHQNQEMISKLDEIIRVFISARERLSSHQDVSQMLQQQQQPQIDPSLQEYWLRTKMVELFQSQLMAERMSSSSGLENKQAEGGLAMELSGRDVQAMASSSAQRPRRRKDDADKRTMRVPAPRMGNTEIPPEDGYTWRKYGQKEILGSRFPRGYYRCTHQKLYQCPAKKQVQRLDDDPYTFEVTYRGDHICHMSATAPSVPPPQLPEITREMTQSAMAAQPPPWLEFSLGGSGSSMAAAGPSTVRYGKEAEFPVADMADVMFNSGSSSSNSMESIFTYMEGKWEPEEKKN